MAVGDGDSLWLATMADTGGDDAAEGQGQPASAVEGALRKPGRGGPADRQNDGPGGRVVYQSTYPQG